MAHVEVFHGELVDDPYELYRDDDATIERREVELASQPGVKVGVLETVPHSADMPPVLWVPGYHNGVEDKLPLAAAFKNRGYALKVVGLEYGTMVRDPETHYPDATATQA